MKKRLFNVVLILVIAFSLSATALAQEPEPPDRLGDRPLPAYVSDLKLVEPVVVDDAMHLIKVEKSLLTEEGAQQVIIRLTEKAVAEVEANNKNKNAQRSQLGIVKSQQNKLLNKAKKLDANTKVLGAAQRAINAVMVEVDAASLGVLAADPNVVSIHRIANYELDLLETVPYIGGSAVHDAGFTGEGVRVAILDSGVDYTHANLGGPGTDMAFHQAYGENLRSGHNRKTSNRYLSELLYPSEKVVGGFDFVGEFWPDGDLAPDPNPIDFEGHGTHVADIIGGVNGVAPGVEIYAVKVCASYSTSCSGVALIQGMEFAIDPDGDGDLSDHVDVINMSLGSNYGQPFDDDLSVAVNNATSVGVLTVASSGNSSDKPYVTGAPGAAATALSVAQTAVPSEFLPFMEVTKPADIAGLYDAVFQSWSTPLAAPIEAPLQYADGAGGNLNGCAPFASGSLAGFIVLVDRGACNFTLKISNISVAGGLVGIIGLVDSSDPFDGGDGGDRPIDIPGYMINQVASNALRDGLPDTVVRFDPEVGIPLIGTVIGSSSRGPRNPDSVFKPEIGAPGASVSAIAGSGTGVGAFGGTSGAAPMVTGSAALILDAEPGLSPLEVKARLMNTGDTDILNIAEGPLAPISRIGGGEVRVDSAVSAPAAAWDEDFPSGGLSFGYVDVPDNVLNLFKTVRVRNYSDEDIVYSITPTFRYADDEATGAVVIEAPSKVKVKAGKDATFTVKMTINGALLPGNFMNSGSNGANGDALTFNEYDGYLILDDGSQPIHMAWHVLPRKAANVVTRSRLTFSDGMDVVSMTNNGVGTAQNDAYSLVAVSENLPEGGLGLNMPVPDIRAVGVNTFPVPAGSCSAEPSFVWAFAVSSWERQTHLVPVVYIIYLDTNQDGDVDYEVYNFDLSGSSSVSDGRQVTWAYNYNTEVASAFFFTEHATNTTNTGLYICAEQVGLTYDDMLAINVDMAVEAWDFYFGGPGDYVDGITVTPYGEQYYGIPADIPGKSVGSMTVLDFGLWPGNTAELGLMLFTNGARSGIDANGGATAGTEALFFAASNADKKDMKEVGVLSLDFSSSQTLFIPMVGR